MTKVTVTATAIIQFSSDGSIKCKLTNHEGVTPKRIDSAMKLLLNDLNQKRAVERHKQTTALAKQKEVTATKQDGDENAKV